MLRYLIYKNKEVAGYSEYKNIAIEMAKGLSIYHPRTEIFVLDKIKNDIIYLSNYGK